MGSFVVNIEGLGGGIWRGGHKPPMTPPPSTPRVSTENCVLGGIFCGCNRISLGTNNYACSNRMQSGSLGEGGGGFSDQGKGGTA